MSRNMRILSCKVLLELLADMHNLHVAHAQPFRLWKRNKDASTNISKLPVDVSACALRPLGSLLTGLLVNLFLERKAA